MLQIAWGDDEHTAKDGVYERLMKSRKWLLLSAVGGLLLARGFLDLAALAKVEVLAVFTVPLWALQQAATLGIVYAIAVYVFLAIQLVVTYRDVLDERLGARQEADLDALRAKIVSLTAESDEWGAKVKGHLPNTHPGVEPDECERRFEQAQHRVNVHRMREGDLMKRDLRRSSWFTTFEASIDLLRVATPLALAIYALWSLGHASASWPAA